ncbi:ECF transporter S component [Abyssisolibacter fermentans]|uniref:ECF transporter S component n=1 Tax=Abyssisolibacter fermentans TaxID=1766203 RepID=UPI0008324D1F|nr:ECF transporter S component [Abyssisolibacter fermentans]
MNKTQELTTSSIFLALGLILPYVFHLTGIAGPILLPMHIPVLLCGFIMGAKTGLLIGFITPLLNSAITGMPPAYPTAIAMAFELAVYGYLTGYLFKNRKLNVFAALIISMLCGRAVSGFINFILLTFGGNGFVLKGFLTASFIKAIPGIIIQLIIIPLIVKVLEQNRLGMKIHG